ncbi:hypothetical protein AAMO2058_001678200 [Amorphochlora amoebiformis]
MEAHYRSFGIPSRRSSSKVPLVATAVCAIGLMFLLYTTQTFIGSPMTIKSMSTTSRMPFTLSRPKTPRFRRSFGKTACEPVADIADNAAPETVRPEVPTPSTSLDYKVLLKVELPEFIPRPDLMEQFLRWAYIEVQQNAKETYGMDEISIEPIYLEPKWVEKYGEDPSMKVVNGFSAQFDEIALQVVMDDEIIYGYDHIGMDENGFPEKRGNKFEVLGKFFEVRKIGDTKASDQTSSAIKKFGTSLNKAFDKYYAFGSIYADDST